MMERVLFFQMTRMKMGYVTSMRCLDVKIAMHAITMPRPLTKMAAASMPRAATAALAPQMALGQSKPMMTIPMVSAMMTKSSVVRIVWLAITTKVPLILELIASILWGVRAVQEQWTVQV
jgi:hypothetical protein